MDKGNFDLGEYRAPFYLKNPHLQLFAANILKTKLFKTQFKKFVDSEKSLILNCGNGVKLTCDYHHQSPNESCGKVIFLHGWEGSSRSSYILSSAMKLYKEGYDVFRLNFRDHGNSHHLNYGLFNATLLDEVIDAVKIIKNTYSPGQCSLVGFSLGGNFALRIAARDIDCSAPLDQIIAICPMINPKSSMKAFEEQGKYYDAPFLKQWKASLVKKQQAFPDYELKNLISKFKTLGTLNDFLVPRYTEFSCSDSYFEAYSVLNESFSRLKTLTTIVSSIDDPLLDSSDLDKLDKSPFIKIERQRNGSHCAFLQNWRLDSWLDDKVLNLLSNSSLQ